MSQKVRTLICLALVCCLSAGVVPAFAGGGHAYETETPTNMATVSVTEQPAETPIPETTGAPAATEEPAVIEEPAATEELAATEEPTDEPAEAPTGEPPATEEQADIQETTEAPTPQESQDSTKLKETELSGIPGAEPEQPTEETSYSEPEQTAEAGTDTQAAQGNNQNDAIELNLPTGEEQAEPGVYLCALHTRTEAYNPASVLISGVLYAPAGTEIQEATVRVAGGDPHVIPKSDILRTRSGSDPVSVAKLTFEPDRERTGFAFLADLRGDRLPDGPTQVTVGLKISRELTLNTTVILNAGLGQYYHVTRAVRGQCLSLDDRDQEDRHVTRFQQKLADLGYLSEDDLSGIFDEKTLAAARGLLERYQRNAGNEYLNPEEVGFILSDQPEAKPEEAEGFFEKVMAFFRGTVPLFNREIPVWMLTAAGAALLLIILIIILLVISRKKKARRQEKEASTMNELSRRSAFISGQEESEQASQILTIGDEPTMDLAEAEAGGGLVFSGDEPTTDLNTPLYHIKLRLIYSGQYMDTSVRLQEGGEAVIGRGDGVQIQSNPTDTSVSHRHGQFSISQETVVYTDNSRNGTRYNGQRMLHKGESVAIPFNTKVQLEIGNHKVLVITNKTNG